VTGTTAGIGRAVASRLLTDGWTVMGVGRRSADIDHAHYRHVMLDLSDLGTALPAIDAGVGGYLDSRECRRVALVNNAALAGTLGPLERIEPDEFHRMTAANVVAPAHLMGLFVARTPIDVPLRIVNLSSGAAVRAFPGLAAYGATKAALRMAAMVLAAELDSPRRNTRRPHDVAILSYEPAVVDTPMLSRTRSYTPDEFPWVDMFHDVAARNMVVAPEQPAVEIVDFLASNGCPLFSEARYGVPR
jgi:benzil reductase ((S)-benzoin forming)